MVKKRTVIFSVVLLCSGMARGSNGLTDLKDPLNELQGGPVTSTLSSKPQSAEEKLAELCSTKENRAVVAKAALYLEMGDIAEQVSGELAQAQSFGVSESTAVKNAISKYGDSQDRNNAIDKMVVGLEGQANALLSKILNLSGQDRIALEKKLATLTSIKNALIDAKDEIVKGGSKFEQGLFEGQVDISNNLYHRRTVEVLVGVGATAIVGAVGWMGKKLIVG
jgi:hypothetical protein